jgi:hypothetical protein
VYGNDFRLGQAMRKNAVAPHPPAGRDRAEGEKMKPGETGAPLQFRGDRVKLNELGRARAPRVKSFAGVVMKVPRPEAGGRSIEVLFDGNAAPTRMHRSYLEIV